MSATLLVMAAGLATRYGGNKQIEPVGPYGGLLFEYAIYDAIKAGFNRVVFVIRESMYAYFNQRIKSKIDTNIEVLFAFQEFYTLPGNYIPSVMRIKPYGTVHAVYCAKDVIDGSFIVINADDYYGETTYRSLYQAMISLHATGEAVMAVYKLKNTLSINGDVTRGLCNINPNRTLHRITETYHIKGNQRGDIYSYNPLVGDRRLDPETPVSMNVWGFTPWIFNEIGSALVAFLEHLDPHDLQAEFPLPIAIDSLLQSGRLDVHTVENDETWYGITYPDDIHDVRAALLKKHLYGTYPEHL